MKALRSLGTLSVAFALLLLLMVQMNRCASTHGGHNIQGLKLPACFLIVAGLLMLFGTRLSLTPLGVLGAILMLRAIYAPIAAQATLDCGSGALLIGIAALGLRLQRRDKDNRLPL